MTTLTSLLALALLGQNVSTPVRVAPETLAWLRKGGDVDVRLAEALLGRPATSTNVALKEAAFLSRHKEVSKSLADSRERATRQLQSGLVAASSPSALLSDGQRPMVRTVLTNGDLLYDFTFSTGLLTHVSFEDGLEDETGARDALSKVVLSKVRIPAAAQTIVAGHLVPTTLPSGRRLWQGVIEFGHAPDVKGIYHISDPQWYDSVDVWTDGEVMFIRYDCDDTVMRSANANPQP